MQKAGQQPNACQRGYRTSNIKLIRLRTFDLSLSGEVTLEDLRKVRGDGGEF